MKSRFPFTSFPNGWFYLVSSEELPVGGVIPLHYFGKDLVLFRTEDGKPYLLDAHCPHLGAHLGYGGKVLKNTVQCPFHGWLFNGNGHCIHIPYASKVPPKAKIQNWLIREVNKAILVYYHAQHNFQNWEIPELPEDSSKEWTQFQQVRQWKIYSHVQELHENAIDTAHVSFLHSFGVNSVKNHTWQMNDLDSIFSSYISLSYNVGSSFAGILGSVAEGSAEGTSYGLGCQVVRVHVKSLIELNFRYILWLTPIDEEYLNARLFFSMKKIFNKPVTNVLRMITSKKVAIALEEDFQIFEHKTYRSEPNLCEGDGPIMQFRHWTRQFYS